MDQLVLGVDEVMLAIHRFAAGAALFALVAAPALAAPQRPFQERDLRSLVTLLDPQISPDGKRVAVVVRKPDFEKNKYVNQLVLVDTSRGTRRVIVGEREDVESPRWSPDGTRLAFIATPPKDPDAKDEPEAQIFVLRTDFGEAVKVSDAKHGVESYAWRPDGGAFAYVTRDDAPDEKRIKAHDDWFEVTDDAWTSRAARVPSHLWTVGADGKHTHRVTRGTWSVEGDPVFAPGGRSLYVVRTPRASTNHYRARSIIAVGLPNGRIRTVADQRSSDGPLLAPGGRGLLYAAESPEAFSQSDLYGAGLDGRDPRDLTARLDRNVQFAVDAHGTIVLGANDGTRDRLFALGARGATRVLPLGDVDLNGGATAAHDGTLAFIGSTAAHPSELYVLRSNARAPQRLTAYNAVAASRRLGRTRTITWRSADGFVADGVLTAPAGAVAGRKYPLIVLIHGGPTATSTDAFSSLAQLMAARGWYVFQPNYRGSDNLGHRWAQATVPHITSAPARDVLDGVDAVERLGVVDKTRIGVSGWSEGGLLTSWLIAHDHRWRAAMSGAAVNDWVGYGDMSDAKDFSPSFIGPSPWLSEKLHAFYEAESPLTGAAAVTTPTLIMTDAGDFRVPTLLSYEFYHAIRATGTPVELMVFPVNGHGPSDPLHRLQLSHLWVDWFAQHF
ncbi:MAG TPA: S9 family peptidase [Candidatus Elarobacter sp.]|nr:S9 family peptidase [Candidatus Elarobacter sp.]